MSARHAPLWPVWLMLLLAAMLELLPLPGGLSRLGPPWTAMVVIYWALMWPGRVAIGTAWLAGLLLDVLQGSLLGQHALSLSVTSYLVLRFHLQMRIFPLWQLTMTVFCLLLLEAFLRLWIDGVAGDARAGLMRFAPAVTGLMVWPLLMALLDRSRERLERRESRFT
ncbi:MAG: rod shape-determining protein MreD [Chromatiales bacterium]|nr:rod shape-determining protein MreD [Chromatiales bacterium]